MIRNMPVSSLQMKIMQSDKEINVVSCGRGAGKTATIALIAIHRMLLGERVLIVAPSFRQANRDDYKQICNFLYDMQVPYTTNAVNLQIKAGKGEITLVSAFGATKETFRGATSISVLIFDEGGSLEHSAYALAIPTMRDLKGAKRRIYIIGTPPYTAEHWMAKAAQRTDAAVFYGSAHDNPFVEKDYVDMIEREYIGFPEDFVRREVYGEMLFDIDDASMFNGFQIITSDAITDGPKIAGLDIAGRGGDMTFMSIVKGRSVLNMETEKTRNVDELIQWVEKMYLKHGFSVLRYDATGFGHLLKFPTKDFLVTPVNFGMPGGKRFATMRGLIYHKLAQKQKIYMPQWLYDKHGRLAEGELKATRFRFGESRLINLVKKEDIKAEIGRSPDRADSLALAFSWEETAKRAEIEMKTVFGKEGSLGQRIKSMREGV